MKSINPSMQDDPSSNSARIHRLASQRTVEREILEGDDRRLRASGVHRRSREIVGKPAGCGGSGGQRIGFFKRENDANVRVVDEIANNEMADLEIRLDELEAVVVRFREKTLHNLLHVQYATIIQAKNANTNHLTELDLVAETKGSKGALSEEASSCSFDSFAALDPSLRP